MAEEKKEALKIEAQLDTSKLKQQAQQGMQDVVNEEKKVEAQSRQTSKAVDNIGQSGKNVGQALQQAGSQGTDALKKVGNEADKTAQKVANIEKSVKNINWGQALGAASRIASSDLGRGVGSAIGDSLGMSGEAQGLAGGAITGALGGAASMAWAGGPGMAVGALVGAASGLLNAAMEQQKAADMQIQAARENLIKREGIARSEISAYRREQDLELANKNYNIAKNAIAGMGMEELTGKESQLGNMRTAQQALIDQTKAQIEGYIKLAEESPGHLASAGEKIVELREQLAKYQEAMKYLDSIQGLVDARKVQLSKPETPVVEKVQLDTERIKGTESLLGMLQKEGQTRLSDSLTRVGGGVGYGSQMQSISSKVVDISKTLKDILNELKNPVANSDEGVF